MGRYLRLALLALLQQYVAADLEPLINSTQFDAGEYGQYPTQAFHSSTALSPRLNFLSTNEACRDGSYTFITPRGKEVDAKEAGGPVILDDAGHLVWTAPRFGKTGDPGKKEETFGLNVQNFKGKDYLTFWVGDDSVQGHGEGTHYMLDEHYEVAYELDGAGDLKADLHDFVITADGTALMTTYKLTQVKGNRRFQGWIWDSVIQEVDIETKETLFQWHASDHYEASESYNTENSVGSQRNPFDFFHVNSIEKDPQGNYLISSRYMHSLTYINGTTGDILWVLGGKRNNFEDLSGGKATSFSWQHHARWANNYSAISIFDNGADHLMTTKKFSRGVLLSIDTSVMTVSLIQEYINPALISSKSQGSVQILPNGNIFMGYGYNSAFTEYTPNGTVLCDTQFGISSRFGTGDVQSYRAFRHNWVGKPKTNPSIAVADNIAYVSWNGATEVMYWMIRSAVEASIDAKTGAATEFYVIKSIAKLGFETGIGLEGIRGDIHIAALDVNGDVLGVTDVITVMGGEAVAEEEWEEAKEEEEEEEASSSQHRVNKSDILLLLLAMAAMMAVVLAWAIRKAVGYWSYRKELQAMETQGNRDEEFLLQGMKMEDNKDERFVLQSAEDEDEDEGEDDENKEPSITKNKGYALLPEAKVEEESSIPRDKECGS